MKKIILIVAILLILIAIPVTLLVVRQRQDIRQKAVPASTIYVDPPTKSVNVGDTFTVDVIIETNQNKVGAAEIKAVYNTNYIEAKSIQKGDFLPSVLVEGIVGNGSATITVANDRNNPAQANGVSGQGTAAVITFEAKQATGDTPTTIQLSDSEASTADPEDFGKNIIISYQNGEVTITGSGSNPSPTPSPQTSPSPGPSGASPSPTPSTSPQQVTKITTPTNGSTVTTRRPRIAGESFVNGSVTLTVNPNSVIASTLTADANGDWEYAPTVDLANGTYTATVLGENSSGTQETATSTFTVSVGTGGDAIATPSPSASTTPNPSASASSEIPVTGSTTPTLLILMTAMLLLAFGVKAIFP